jgi:hypothetical protein
MKSPSLAGVIVENENPTKNATMLSVREKLGFTEFTMIFHLRDFNIIVMQVTRNARKRNITFAWARISIRALRFIRESIMRKRMIPTRLNNFILLFICSHNCLPDNN